MALFCLSAFFCVFLGAFLLLHSLYIYPLTVRYIGVPLSFAGYLVGSMLFNLHYYLLGETNRDASTEIALSASILIIVHAIILHSHNSVK